MASNSIGKAIYLEKTGLYDQLLCLISYLNDTKHHKFSYKKNVFKWALLFFFKVVIGYANDAK